MVACTCRKAVYEESPGSIGQRCRVTPGEGDFKESATERYRGLENREQRSEIRKEIYVIFLKSSFCILLSVL